MKRHLCPLGRYLTVAFALIVAVSCLAAVPACASTDIDYVPDEYIIHVRPGTDIALVENAVDRMGAHVVRSLPLPDYYLIKLGRVARSSSPSGTEYAYSRSASTTQWVIDRIQPNGIYRACATPSDPYWWNQWDMDMINMPQAWDIEKGSEDVIVAVVDTGVAYNSPSATGGGHPDIADRCIAGYDFVDDDNDPFDLEGHGTHVAGTIAAQGGNLQGICGVCWNGVKIMPVRSLGADGSGTTDQILDGLDYALSHGADVVNMSLGGSPRLGDEAYRAKIVELTQSGVIVVAAAGNDATDVGVPAMYPEVICVGSVGPYEEIAEYSSFGPGYEVDIVAPGGDSSKCATYPDNACLIFSTTIEFYEDDDGVLWYFTDYGGMEGTSMACPHVAGAAALLLSQGIPASAVRDRLLDTARTPSVADPDPIKYGAGILDVFAALDNASVRVVSPAKGGVVGSDPEFKINLRGVSTSTIKVYVDYTDVDDDGRPDGSDTSSIVIDSSNVNVYLEQDNAVLRFDWSDLGKPALTAGRHDIYIKATPTTGGAIVEDWANFTVAGLVMSAGIHLFALPCDVDPTVVRPSDILIGTDFTRTNPNRSVLKRWLPTTGGYATYDPANTSDIVWRNPVSGGVPLGGGYLANDTSDHVFPAGSGFWLVLPYDTVVDESYAALDAPGGYSIPLYAGWNMIGNPYTDPTKAMLFSYAGGQPKTLQDAVSAGWVSGAIYGYRTEGTVGYYRLSTADLLQPYTGYWIYAYEGGTSALDALTLTVLP